MERVEHCFMVDRMLGRLVAWLRIFGYDTKSALDLTPSPQEDTSLIEISKNEHRILLSRDRALVERAKKAGVDAVLLGSDDVRMQLDELMRCYHIDADPVMTRCTACNYTLRKAMENDLDYIKNSPVVPEGLAKDSFRILDMRSMRQGVLAGQPLEKHFKDGRRSKSNGEKFYC